MLFAWFVNVSGSASIEIIISAHGRFCNIDATNGPKVFNSLANILEITQEKLSVLSVNRFHLSKFSKQHLFLNFMIFCSKKTFLSKLGQMPHVAVPGSLARGGTRGWGWGERGGGMWMKVHVWPIAKKEEMKLFQRIFGRFKITYTRTLVFGIMVTIRW